MSEKRFNIIGIGEILLDLLPTRKKLGGAPANFAFTASQLGDCGTIVSRVGDDKNGAVILGKLKSYGLEINEIQIDRKNLTGTVKVNLKNGQPEYEILEPVAWDFLEMNDNLRDLAKKCDAVCFGSLAQRNTVSRRTIREFLRLIGNNTLRIFDTNLRQNYYSPEVLSESLALANVIKLNDEELPKICEIFAVGGANETEQTKKLLEKFDLNLVCLTRGAEGSLLVTENGISENHGIKVKIADTIGAGDAFTAALTHGFLRGWSLNEINEKASRVGAFVASQTGAMPSFKEMDWNEKTKTISLI